MARKKKGGAATTSSRRDEILSVAAKVIAEKGIKQATVRDIGDAAGILSGSLYYHFDSKDQIVLELLLPAIEMVFEKSTAIRAEASGLDALRRLIRDSVHESAESPDRSVILRNEARIFAELPLLAPINEYRAKIVDLWVEVIEEGIAAGQVRSSIDADVVARAILDGTLGASRWFDGNRSADPEVISAAIEDFYVGGLEA